MITYDLDTADVVTIDGRTISMEFYDHAMKVTLPRTARITHWFRGKRHQIVLGTGRSTTTIIGRPAQIQFLWETLTDSNPTK